jgi:hypothetical protein
VAVVLCAAAPRAWAQACCSAPSLTTPARLGWDERWAAGIETRARAVFGAFGADGSLATTSAGDVEAEQDVFAAARFLARAQVGVAVPFVQTRRTVPGLSQWGGGLGDVRASARVELTRAGARPYVPGLALLFGASAPTGRPADQATGVLAADATGTGSWEGTLGLEIEQQFERAFVTLAAAVAQRTSREALGVAEAFAPRLTVVASLGTVTDGGWAWGASLAGMRAGPSRDQSTGRSIAGSDLALVTAGLAAQAPLGDGWRGLARASVDCPFDGLGRNEATGAGLSVSMLRFWP